jgi:hypothetical protein
MVTSTTRGAETVEIKITYPAQKNSSITVVVWYRWKVVLQSKLVFNKYSSCCTCSQVIVNITMWGGTFPEIGEYRT